MSWEAKFVDTGQQTSTCYTEEKIEEQKNLTHAFNGAGDLVLGGINQLAEALLGPGRIGIVELGALTNDKQRSASGLRARAPESPRDSPASSPTYL